MKEGHVAVIRREDYVAPAYWIRTVDLTFDLDPDKTLVINRMTVERNAAAPAGPLRLDGEDLNLTRVLVNGAPAELSASGEVTLEGSPGDSFQVEVETPRGRRPAEKITLGRDGSVSPSEIVVASTPGVASVRPGAAPLPTTPTATTPVTRPTAVTPPPTGVRPRDEF